MKQFEKIADGLEVAPVLAQLDVHPELWNQHAERTQEDSPHYGVPDIWVRFRPRDELTEPVRFKEPHFAEFYPAWYRLASLHPIVFELMAQEKAVYLGGILITRIPPGGEVKPHHDRGGWHAEFHNRKVYVPLQSNDDCVNHCEGESVVMRVGEAWSFDNLKVHSVSNDGKTDRITAIICMRVEP